jgi:hypothetical protein
MTRQCAENVSFSLIMVSWLVFNAFGGEVFHGSFVGIGFDLVCDFVVELKRYL